MIENEFKVEANKVDTVERLVETTGMTTKEVKEHIDHFVVDRGTKRRWTKREDLLVRNYNYNEKNAIYNIVLITHRSRASIRVRKSLLQTKISEPITLDIKAVRDKVSIVLMIIVIVLLITDLII